MAKAFLRCATGCPVWHVTEDDNYEQAKRRVREQFVKRGLLHYCATCAARRDREARQMEAR